MDIRSLLPPRSVEDIFADRVVVSLGGVRYVLPVRSMRASREWEERLDLDYIRLLRVVTDADSDLAVLLGAVADSPFPFIDTLLAYDEDGILPDRDTIFSVATEWELFLAIHEVWRAAHPLADTGIELMAMSVRRANALPGLTSSLWPRGATASDSSGTN